MSKVKVRPWPFGIYLAVFPDHIAEASYSFYAWLKLRPQGPSYLWLSLQTNTGLPSGPHLRAGVWGRARCMGIGTHGSTSRKLWGRIRKTRALFITSAHSNFSRWLMRVKSQLSGLSKHCPRCSPWSPGNFTERKSGHCGKDWILFLAPRKVSMFIWKINGMISSCSWQRNPLLWLWTLVNAALPLPAGITTGEGLRGGWSV